LLKPATSCFFPEAHPVLGGTTIDHLIPVSDGGPDEEWNFRLAHSKCNNARANLMDPDAIIRRVAALFFGPYLHEDALEPKTTKPNPPAQSDEKIGWFRTAESEWMPLNQLPCLPVRPECELIPVSPATAEDHR
jgi:hypothetical protein